MENQNRIKTSLPKGQYITYHVPKNASAALTFYTISKYSSIADSETLHRLLIGTRFKRSVARADSAPGSGTQLGNVFRELMGPGVVA